MQEAGFAANRPKEAHEQSFLVIPELLGGRVQSLALYHGSVLVARLQALNYEIAGVELLEVLRNPPPILYNPALNPRAPQ